MWHYDSKDIMKHRLTQYPKPTAKYALKIQTAQYALKIHTAQYALTIQDVALCPNKSDCAACSNKVIWCNRRTAFKAADITGTHTLTLQEDTTYKAVHLPLALPIPFGIDDAAKGTITEATLDILDTMVLDGAFWAKCALTYDTAQPDKLIRRTADGIGKIGNCLILQCASYQPAATMQRTRQNLPSMH